MRTTVNLDDDVLEAATKRAKRAKTSLGKAISNLVRRGLQAGTRVIEKNGLYVPELPPDSPKVTPDQIKRLESEGL